jgi:hypothetical protein
LWSELIFDWISGEVLEEWREEGAASAGSEEVLVEWREEGAAPAGSEEVLEEWREEGAAPAGSEEGVVPAEWREKMLQQGLRKELV